MYGQENHEPGGWPSEMSWISFKGPNYAKISEVKCICVALFRNHMEGTDFDKHFKGYQPQPVVESDAADFEEADMEVADLEAEEIWLQTLRLKKYWLQAVRLMTKFPHTPAAVPQQCHLNQFYLTEMHAERKWLREQSRTKNKGLN